MGDEGKAPAWVLVEGEYSDERFIDMMAAHHMAAIELAKVARQHGEHQEIKQLAEKEISHQRAQVDKLSSIRAGDRGRRGDDRRGALASYGRARRLPAVSDHLLLP